MILLSAYPVWRADTSSRLTFEYIVVLKSYTRLRTRSNLADPKNASVNRSHQIRH